MRLRTRLIVAFLVLSVVPLGAMTYYSYTSQVRAMRDLATREADALSTEMTQRMQLVTTELSNRVEQLVDMQPDVVRVSQTANARPAGSSASRPTAPAASAPVAPAAPAVPTIDLTKVAMPVVNAMTGAKQVSETQVAEALGAAAMLLRTVELQGMRGPRPSGGGRGPGRSGDPSRVVDPTRPPDANRPPDPNRPGDQNRQLGPNRQVDGRQGRGGNRSPRPDGPPGTAQTGAPGSPGTTAGAPRPLPVAPAAAVTPTLPVAPSTGVVANPGAGAAAGAVGERIVIDMGAITREMFSKYVPEGGFEKMTPEQRQQLGRDINQRVMGIAEGIRLSAEQLQKKAEAAKQKPADASLLAVPLAPKPPPAPAAARPAAAAPASSPVTTSSSTPAITPAPKLTRSSVLTGNRLDVKLSQDGKVVSQVNATIDLENVLATVFSPTRRERGEVPFAVGPDGRVYTVSEADRKTVQDLGPIARPDGPLGRTVLPDWVVFTTADPSGSGLRFGIARPVGDRLDELRRTAGRNAGLGLLLILVLFVGVVPLSGSLTRNLTALTEGVDRIAHGDYAARVPVRAKDEIGELAMAFNKMAADVERHQQSAVEQERLRHELELGRQIQAEMLPREPMLFGMTEVQGVSIPAREVGGDFFNYFALDNGKVALVVGDVSGKGVGAALLMANIQASLRTRLALGQSLAAIAEAIDRELASTATTRLYVTLFLGIFDPATRQLLYVNAGHNPQFVLRPNQPIERMAATGIPIGLLAGHGYTQREVTLSSGDLIFFYTDGCVETENEADEMFGTDRLEALLVSMATLAPVTPDRVLQQVEQAVTAFRGTREPFDDATMMAVRIG
jgi:serine phosphatase RsbU (regulator of sigma subunit)